MPLPLRGNGNMDDSTSLHNASVYNAQVVEQNVLENTFEGQSIRHAEHKLEGVLLRIGIPM